MWDHPPESPTDLLASMNGQPLNISAVARLLGVSRPAAASCLMDLQRQGLIRLLPSHTEGRRPLLYLRDGYRHREGGVEFRAFCTEEVIARFPEGVFSWWMTGRVRQIDLVVDLPGHRVGFRFDPIPARNSVWLPLAIGMRRGVITRGFVLHAHHRAYFVKRFIHALPLRAFLEEPAQWVYSRQDPHLAMAAMERINSQLFRR